MKAWRVTSDLGSAAQPAAQQIQLFGDVTPPSAG
jgi:hypothetical protein